jgi:hypothetical protein
MFEGWVADVLATYLGKFIDVQKDQLGISLWSGGLAACVLRAACPLADPPAACPVAGLPHAIDCICDRRWPPL